MSKTIKKCIVILTLAGILLTPACSDNNKKDDLNISKDVVTASPSPSDQQGEEGIGQTTEGGITTGEPQKPQETKDAIQVITSDEELEEYFDSISDEELEELFKIIEGIDISSDIDPDADPRFDDIIIP